MSIATSHSATELPVTVPYPWWEGAGCLAIRLDDALRVAAANGVAERLFPCVLTGRPWLSLLDADARDRALALARQAASASWTVEQSLAWRTDPPLVLQTRLIQSDAGLVVCAVASLLDMADGRGGL